VRNIRLLFLSGLLSVLLNLSAQNPFIQHYTLSDGLPSNTVYQIYQDSQKFIWFAMADGLVRYDGSTFTIYRKKDGLSHINVYNPHEDSFGRIWVACPDKKNSVNFFWQNKIYNSKNAPFLDSIRGVDIFFEDKDRVLYFYRFRKIYSLDTSNKIKKYEIPSVPVKSGELTKEGMNIAYLTKSPTGEFLIWTSLGIFKTKHLSQKPVFLSSLPHDYYLSACENTTVFVRIQNPKTKKYVFIKYVNGIPVDSTELPVKTQRPVRGVLEDANGILWICTRDLGVFCLKNKRVVSHFDIKEADYIMQDHENNIWISARKGVYKISPYFLQSKHFDTGYFHDEGIEGMGADFNNGIWCANGEWIYLLKNNEIFSLDCHLRQYTFNRIYGLKNNCIIIGKEKSFDQFVLTGIRADQATGKVYYRNKFKLPPVFKIAVDNTGTEFSAVALPGAPPRINCIVTYSAEKQFKEINRVDMDISLVNACNLNYDANNNLVINAQKNYIVQNYRKVPSKELSEFNGKNLYFHQILNDTTELYLVENDSIFVVTKSKTYNLSSYFGYPIDMQIHRVVYDKPNLYLSTLSNVYKCGNPLLILENKPVKLQLLDINFRNIHDILARNDSLYVASDDGLTVIPEALLRKITPHIPIPYFQSIMINDSTADLSQLKISITGNNKIKFCFGCINYSATPLIYSYKLEGLDQDWTTGKGTNVVYQNLSRGNYIFKVRARKASTEWSNPIECKITIKAHFWQHPLFFVFLSLLFTGFIALLIIRRKNIQIKRSELDNQLITLEQKALQSMMNPHFIFNSLGSIQNYLLQKKSGEAGLYLSQFARLIRQNLNAINTASINLEEEIDRLKNYLDLEKLRMENKFEYSIEVDENVEADEVQIPSMIIQPFVENAIWHGISAIEEKGQIAVKFRMHGEKSLAVIVEDNGIGIKRSKEYSPKQDKHFHLGMEMTRKRLELLGKKYSIKTAIEFFESSPGSPNPGTRVELIVPVGA
jgi:hypothetical protein